MVHIRRWWRRKADRLLSRVDRWRRTGRMPEEDAIPHPLSTARLTTSSLHIRGISVSRKAPHNTFISTFSISRKHNSTVRRPKFACSEWRCAKKPRQTTPAIYIRRENAQSPSLEADPTRSRWPEIAMPKKTTRLAYKLLAWLRPEPGIHVASSILRAHASSRPIGRRRDGPTRASLDDGVA